jgi:phosphate:Na+ symporter
MEMDYLKIFYFMLGGLGLFYYGIKSISESFQSIAGDFISKAMNSLSANKYIALIVGFLVTSIIQSSSITSVMVVGLVNAGLMKLTEAIGVIIGANIGTTVTGWVISVNAGSHGLLLIGLGILPIIFAKKDQMQSLGRVVFGFGLLFTGLMFLKDAFLPLAQSESFMHSIQYFQQETYGSYFVSIILGCLLTMILQSSLAMVGITMALATTGIIPFSIALSLVLGENIGKTITAVLASIGANTNAKRAARAHALFNIFGVSVFFFLIPQYTSLVESLIPGIADFVDENGTRPFISLHIAASHTLFNLVTALALIPFVEFLSELVTKMTPDKQSYREDNHLVHLGDPTTILPATAIVQAHSEIKKFKDIVDRMYKLTRELLSAKNNDPEVITKIRDYERITDNIQKEITLYLCVVMEKNMTLHQSLQTQSLVRIADELESVADYLNRIVDYKIRFNDDYNPAKSGMQDYFVFMDKVWDFFQLSFESLFSNETGEYERVLAQSEEIRLLADEMRDKYLDRVSKGEYSPISALTYSDMVVALRKIRAHALNIAEALINFHKEA